MNAILPNSMLEATRLTREGKLTEASALLQRLLHGEAPVGAAAAGPQTTVGPAVGRQPRIIDVDPATGEASAPAAAAPRAPTMGRWPTGGLGTATMPQMPDALRGFLDQINQGGLAQGLNGLAQGSVARVPCAT